MSHRPQELTALDRARLSALGRRVRAARQAAGLSQRALAENIRTDHAHIVRVEAGRISIGVVLLGRLADATGTTPAQLMADGDEQVALGATGLERAVP